MMTQFHKRREFIHQNNQFCNKPAAYFKNEYQRSREYYINPASEDMAQILHKDGGKGNVVVLSELNCDCLGAQDRIGPCRHVHAFCRHLKKDPEQYMSYIYSVITYKETYKEVTSPLVVDLNTIEEDHRFSAPTLKPFQGRKQMKRKRKGDRASKQTEGQACGWCGKEGQYSFM